MTLDEYLVTRTVDNNSLESRIETLRTDPATNFFVRALRAEARLPEEVWEQVVDTLCTSDNSVAELRSNLTAVFRNNQLRGGPTPQPWAQIYGRALGELALKRSFLQSSLADTDEEVSALFAEVLTLNAAELRVRLAGHKFDQFLTWATRNDGVPDADPFDGFSQDADDVRFRLGLDRNEQGLPILLIRYNLPTSHIPHYPTISEGYASDSWVWQFLPSDRSKPWGETIAWDGNACCPEVIHSPVAVDTVVDAIVRLEAI